MHDVRRIIDQFADARFVPWFARLAPFPARQCDIDLLGQMTMVGMSHMRDNEGDTDPDIAAYRKSLRTDDCRVSMPVQKRLALRLGACPYLPMELPLDDVKGIGQGTNSTLQSACVSSAIGRWRQTGNRAAPPSGLARWRPQRSKYSFGSHPHQFIDT